MAGKTLYDKIWESHIVDINPDGTALIYIDMHLTHEVTSPQAFAGLRSNQRKVRRPDLTIAVADHAIPTNHNLGLSKRPYVPWGWSVSGPSCPTFPTRACRSAVFVRFG